MFLIYKFIIMKKLLTLGLILLSTISFAQNGFNYKALITNNGNAVANQSVNIRFTLLENGTTSVYQETHSATTDANGIVSVDIGEGTIVSGDFSTLDWGNNTYFLKVEIDTGSGYQDFGTSELKYVPYAKYADKAGNVFSGDFNDLTNVPAGLSDGDDVNDADADPTNEIQTISKTGNTITLSNGGGSVTDSDTHLTEAQVDAYVANNGYLTQVDNIRGIPVSATPPATGQILKYNGTEYVPADDNTSGGSGTDGVVNSAAFSGTTTKTLTLGRSNGLSNITASFTDLDTHLSDADITAMGYIKNANDADHDPNNELQNLTLSGTQLSISNGNHVDFTGWDTDASDDFSGDYNDLSNKPHVWNVSGTTDAATNNSQSIVHSGSIGIGTTDLPGTNYSKLYVSNDDSDNAFGVEVEMNSSDNGSNNKYGYFASLITATNGYQAGLRTYVDNSGDAESAGVDNFIPAGGAGNKYGVKNLLDGDGSGEKYGVYNEIEGNGTGIQVGTSNNLGGAGTGIQVGTLNQVENDNDNILAGSVNLIHGNGDATLVGTHSTISGTGNGIVYAVSDSIINTGTGDHYGMHSYISGGDGGFYGLVNELNEGGGEHYAIINFLSGNGDGEQVGNMNYITNTGTGNKAGQLNIIQTNPGSSQHGIFNILADNVTPRMSIRNIDGMRIHPSNINSNNRSMAGPVQVGVKNIIAGNDNTAHLGIFNWMVGDGSGTQYGIYNVLTDGTGPKYGTYNEISAGSPGQQIAVYGQVVNNPGNFAGYFIGDMAITNGKLGVGTDAPEQDIHVKGDDFRTIEVESTSDGGSAKIKLQTNSSVNDNFVMEKKGPNATGFIGTSPNQVNLANLSMLSAGADAGPMAIRVVTNNPMYFFTDNEVRMTLEADGNLELKEKLTAPDSGDADMKAYIYGVINYNGDIDNGTDGFTVQKTGTGVYKITFDTPMSHYTDYTVVATLRMDNIGFISTDKFSSYFYIRTYDTGGNHTDMDFDFVVYKK